MLFLFFPLLLMAETLLIHPKFAQVFNFQKNPCTIACLNEKYVFLSFQFGRCQPWESNQSLQSPTLPKWKKSLLPMALLEVYSLTTFGMFHPLLFNVVIYAPL